MTPASNTTIPAAGHTTTDPATATGASGTAGVSDPRPLLAHAVTTAGEVIAAVTAEQFERRTPCDAFDVRQLVGHMLFALRRTAGIGRGEDVRGFVVTDVADDRWSAAWNEVAGEVADAWRDPARLGEECVLPFATLPGYVAVGIYTSELTVHAWDLARAIGHTVAWDDAVVAFSLAIMRDALPADGRIDLIPFDGVVEVAATAPLIDQLIGWVGRRPTWPS